MLQAIGHILPIALAVAISSVPIMATILILLSPKRAQSAIPFLIGWVLGIAVGRHDLHAWRPGDPGVPLPEATRHRDRHRRDPRSAPRSS